MPEGDTIATVARRLSELIEGATLVEVRLRGSRGHPLRAVESLAGTTVARIDTVGKHLLVFAGPDVIRVHLGMSGSWHRYRPGERWRMPRRLAWVVLATRAVEVVCFEPQVVERFPAARLDRNPALARLGPDLLAPAVDWGAITARARDPVPDDGTVGTLLLDQTVAAGIGNVFRSEVLFLEGVHPHTPTASLDDAAVEALYRRARSLLQANVGSGMRRTTPRAPGPRSAGSRPPGSAHWVYGRAGRPCSRCGASVRSGRQGRHARVVFWCPSCQPVP